MNFVHISTKIKANHVDSRNFIKCKPLEDGWMRENTDGAVC